MSGTFAETDPDRFVEPDVRRYRADGTMARLRDGHELDGEDVVPGFRCAVSELWPEHVVQGWKSARP